MDEILEGRVIASNWQSCRIFVHVWWHYDTHLDVFVDGKHLTEDMWRTLAAIHLANDISDLPGAAINKLLDEVCDWFNVEKNGKLVSVATTHDDCIVLPDTVQNVETSYFIILGQYRLKEVPVKKMGNMNSVWKIVCGKH